MQEYSPTSAAQYAAANARTTPELERVRDGVWAIPLPLPRAGIVESTLCYSLLDGDGGVHLIDPGWDTEDNMVRLREGLATAGFDLDAVRSVICTHLHPDHIGLAARLSSEHDIPLVLHEIESAALANPRYSHPEETMVRWGVPAEQVPDLVVWATRSDDWRRPAADTLVRDGETLDIPGRTVRVIHTPGHTAGSMCLHDERDGLFFSGDHVLPIINPGLGLGGFDPADDPIGAALDSYRRVESFDSAEVCPGHGYRFTGLTVRARQLADRHRRRSAEVAAILRDDPEASVWHTASGMTWTDGWDNLEPFARVSALAQTEMHARHIANQGA